MERYWHSKNTVGVDAVMFMLHGGGDMVVEEIHASNHAHTQYSVKAGFPWLAVHTGLLTMWNTSKNTHTHTHISHTHIYSYV